MRINARASLFISIFILSAGLFAAQCANAGELDTKMEKMSKRMIKSVNDKNSRMENATMAIFPFSADEKLTKKKVDFAVTELKM